MKLRAGRSDYRGIISKIEYLNNLVRIVKELATRILNQTGGAPAGKLTETALKVQSERLEMINNALKSTR